MTKIYLWENVKNYPEKCWGDYDQTHSCNYIHLMNIQPVTDEEISPHPIIRFETTRKDLLKFDRLKNFAEPLVSPCCQKVLAEVAGECVQFIPTTLECTDGVIDDYVIVNVIKAIDAIDLDASEYDTMIDGKTILGFNKLIIDPLAMQAVPVARDINNRGDLLVNQEVVDAFKRAGLNAGQFFDPYEYYADM